MFVSLNYMIKGFLVGVCMEKHILKYVNLLNKSQLL